jgi:hypothetical protein
VVGAGLEKKYLRYPKFGDFIYVVLPLTKGNRFLKQRLHWTLPKLSTPKQCVGEASPKGLRWSDLMPMITWELWLARDIVADNPLPWQKSIDKLTPVRVAQAMGIILEGIGTPARSPKSRGKSRLLGTGKITTT